MNPESTLVGRRVSDAEIMLLIAKVNDLDQELIQLRVEFEGQVNITTAAHSSLVFSMGEIKLKIDAIMHELANHTRIEETKFTGHDNQFNEIKRAIELLTEQVKEPMEVYKTAKSGVTFAKWFVETCKWLGPLLIGLFIGINAYLK